ISQDGQHQIRVHQIIPWTPETSIVYAEQLGIQLAEQALAQGADQIIAPATSRRGGSGIVQGGGPRGRPSWESNQLEDARDTQPYPAIENPQRAPAPLQGKRILVTRTPEQAPALSDRLESLGATPIEFPTIRIIPPTDWEPLDNAL